MDNGHEHCRKQYAATPSGRRSPLPYLETTQHFYSQLKIFFAKKVRSVMAKMNPEIAETNNGINIHSHLTNRLKLGSSCVFSVDTSLKDTPNNSNKSGDLLYRSWLGF